VYRAYKALREEKTAGIASSRAQERELEEEIVSR
jgi:hypothetical protein